jgi:hypothetical protein
MILAVCLVRMTNRPVLEEKNAKAKETRSAKEIQDIKAKERRNTETNINNNNL